MAIAGGASIEAVLTLNASGFETALSNATTLVKNFVTQVNATSGNIAGFQSAISGLVTELNDANLSFSKFQSQAKGIESFNKFANGVKALATAVDTLGKESNETSVGLERVTGIIKSLESTFGTTEVKITGVSNALRRLIQEENGVRASSDQMKTSFSQAQQTLATLSNAVQPLAKVQEQMGLMRAEFDRARTGMLEFANYGVQAFNQVDATSNKLKAQINSMNMEFERSKAQLMEFARYGLTAFNEFATGEQKASASTKQLNSSINQTTSSIQRQAGAYNTASASSNRFATATSRLGKAMSSLRMIGNLVGSMLAYNFAHKLLVATGETIHAKSEMEGYFRMLNFGQDEIDGFNRKLDETVAQFQRVNKYSLGETISSIGVEFNLSTKEMEKAMPVVSMITSEYLRAGRNANEASLAVKDVLQGQFQRLSRETGVKGEDLKEAGWSGDNKDVLGLMEALEKVGKSRNWDIFAEKANSLNDILTILQNRFGEWSADMVNSVQPTIVGAFNAIMDVGGMMAQSLSGIWNWFTGGSWEATASQIGLVTGAVLVLSQAFVMYRSQLGFVQASQLGLKGSIMSVITGLKGQQVAEMGVRNSIMAKILGVKAETLAEGGVARAIEQKLAMTKLETVEEKLNTLSSKENSVAKMENALQTDINKARIEGLITAEEADTLRKELNTAMTEANALASLKQAGVNGGLTTTFIMLAGAENATAVATGEISVAMGVLNGIMAVSPIGWFMGAIMALAGAFYVLSGGLDAHWDKMKTFNETLDNSKDIVKANKDHLKELKDTLGEDSEEYKNASESVKTFNENLKASKKLVKEYNQELDTLPVKLGEISSANSKGSGISEDGMKELSEYATGLEEGQKTYYRALQVLHKQQDDYEKSDRTMIHNMQERGAEEQDILSKREQHMEHYSNFMKHSAEHNTSDDWWGGTWAGLLAGIDSMQLWLDYKTEDLAQWWHDFSEDYSKLPEQLGEAWNNIDWGALGDIGGRFSQWIDDAKKSIDDSWKSLTETFKPITDFLNDPLKMFGMDAVSASDGSSDHPSFMEDVSSILGFDVQAWVDSFMADPLGTLGIDLGGFDIFGTLINYLFGIGDAIDFSWATEWLNNNVITPISETWNTFMADPLSFIGGAVLGAGGIGGLLTLLLPSDGGVGIWEWVNTTIIQPMSQALWSGITSIPLVSDILALFGLVDGENSGSSQKGKDLGEAFKTAIEDKIRNIPILGDILQMLGVIPNANGDAHSKGHDVGENIKKGEESGHQGMADNIRGEMGNVINAISEKAGEAYAVAHDVGSRILNGIKDALDMHSPSIISRELISNEFGTYIPEAITSNGELAYQSAQYYGQQITAGISSVNTDSLGLDTAVGNYETDAQMIAMSSQMMGMETTTAFNDMSLAVNNTTATMSANVGTTYSQMQQKQTSSLQSMKTQNQTAYNEMYLKSNQSLIQMRDSTSNITQQMVSAWSHMKTQLVATANQLRSESTSHFNKLSDTIGSFYRKIQNPSNWGAGTGSSTPVRSRRNTTAGRSFARGMRTRTSLHGAGTSSTYTGNKYMTIGSLKKKLCPDGSCDYLFNGMDSSERVNVEEFLATITGEHGFGGWSGWNTTHFNHIKNTSDQWDMKSPVIQVMGGIPTNAQFKVGDFENGTPSISFDSFKSMAESIFAPGGIPYKHYMDSAWKGSWLGAIQAGACNCSDGAEAIIAFASACGFGGGQKVHGYWGNEGHFWAVINGEVFDTTAMQKGYGWRSPSVHGYGTKVRTTVSSGDAPSNGNKTVNVTIDMSNSTIYGVDDLDSRIKTGVEEGLKEQFNDPYTVELI